MNCAILLKVNPLDVKVDVSPKVIAGLEPLPTNVASGKYEVPFKYEIPLTVKLPPNVVGPANVLISPVPACTIP